MRLTRPIRLAGALLAPLLVTGAIIAQTGAASAGTSGGGHGTRNVPETRAHVEQRPWLTRTVAARGAREHGLERSDDGPGAPEQRVQSRDVGQLGTDGAWVRVGVVQELGADHSRSPEYPPR